MAAGAAPRSQRHGKEGLEEEEEKKERKTFSFLLLPPPPLLQETYCPAECRIYTLGWGHSVKVPPKT